MTDTTKATIKSVHVGATATIMALVMSITVPNIKNLEGTKYTAYKDIAGVLTVCSGHTGVDVVIDKTYSDEQCSELTEQDAEKAAEGVLKVSPHLIYHPMQLASAISFSYNVGVGTYAESSVSKDFNSGNFITACNDLMKYVYADHKYSVGLENRRKKEQTLCLSTMTSTPAKGT